MKITEYGEIIEISVVELYKKFITEEYYKLYSFKDFITAIEKQGTKITGKGEVV